MILALLIYLGAHTGVIVATPTVINALAVGSVVTSAPSYEVDATIDVYER